MEKVFRNYKYVNSSIFDLIDGDTEVKQTIALGYLLSQDENILRQFLSLKPIVSVMGKYKETDFSKIIIHTELTSKNDKRIDISIQFYKNNKPIKALIIEAKNIKLNISPKNVVNQITKYLENEEFKELHGFEVLYGCILSKNNFIFKSEKIVSISWSDIINILYKSAGLAKDFLTFLTRINGSMNFYEKEVYSVPAGETSIYQYGYPHIYECPNSGKNYKSIKKPLYFAFRQKDGGIMEKLFGVEKIIILNPNQDFESFLDDPSYSDTTKERIKNYCDNIWGEEKYSDDEKQFFILSSSNQINLSHKPRPKANNSFRAYYKLSDLLDVNKIYVEAEK
ncbi:hypothetical protein [Thiothrix subterranea]|uniref:Uncharacterized protein n=1 Tax=Thiothrix subterranea TaxID=2735563 RepID=A0AA51MPH9_9GAMM|nr:hypothetical protein [Thiothrix subterranea]MDQ5770813.1 hypothetical protein [Thiothrix subterranea]WML85861.1 hypothetical protein RCG00_16345 [Thiothrix subterranea]